MPNLLITLLKLFPAHAGVILLLGVGSISH